MTESASRIVAITALAFALPALFPLCFWGRGVPFELLAADAFYYLTVARNVVEHGLVSFDQETLTNGFHPLWQLCSVGLYALGEAFGGSPGVQLRLPLLLGIILLVGALVLLGSCARQQGRLSPCFVLLPFGATTLVTLPALALIWKPYRPDHPPTSLWGSVNGMESALVVATFALLALLFTRQRRSGWRRGIGFGLALTALTFARLDHGIFALAALVALLVDRRRDPHESSASYVAASGFTFLGCLALYLVVNHFVFGSALPVSGSLKSSFPEFTRSSVSLLGALVTVAPDRVPGSHALRGLQLVVPTAFALGFLGLAWRRRQRPTAEPERRYALLLVASAFGALGLFLYNLCFVPKMAQGHWYFPLSNVLASLFVLHLLPVISVRHSSEPRAVARISWKAAAPLALGAAFVALYPMAYTPDQRSPQVRFLYEEAPQLRKRYAKREPRVIAFDDGFFAFATGFPTASGMGLTLDAEAAKKLKRARPHPTPHDILRLGHQRGYRHFAAGPDYVKRRLGLDSSKKAIERAYRPLFGRKPGLGELRVEYASKDSRYAMIRIE